MGIRRVTELAICKENIESSILLYYPDLPVCIVWRNEAMRKYEYTYVINFVKYLSYE